MSIFNPRTWFGSQQEAKASAAGSIVMPYGVGLPVWTPRDYASFGREAYQLNPIGYRCAKMISVCATVPGWLLFDKAGNEITEHELLDLLARPAPGRGGAFFFEAVYTYLMLAGNSYIEKVGPEGKPPKELWTQRPDRMKVIPGQYGLPSAYQFEMSGKKKTWPVNQVTLESDILHLREFHPLDDWYGLSRVEPAGQGIDRHNSASAHNKALLDNGARPSGALVFQPITTDGQVISAPDDVLEKAERELNKRHGGPKNSGKPMVFGGNVKWEEMGISPKDMDFDASKQDAARDICVAWGVPHILIVRGSSTYNNVKEAKVELYEETVLPLVQSVTSELNAWLTPMFGDGLKLAPDLDSIPALEPRRESKRKTHVELLEKGVLDADEVREALQYGPRKAGSIQSFDASVLTALVNAVETTGYTPLLRYMKSVGLFDPSMTEKQVLEEAMRVLDDLDDDDVDPDDDDDDDTDPENEDDDDE
ncbi:phage portal protein [Sulfitobacter sp. EhC04]|uniref:phage portal protein n=1 Tax=Sulfitobacter sp. EhC04 TaxID=1849168 RepID=UPI0007F4AA9F|nr:phage portal protein [Sulfitobacter sp. EhC04]OAN76747.1 phage portal protein [Sulfitobacter sp. EhC04]